MGMEAIRRLASRRPGWVIGTWLVVAGVVGVLSPDLTRLAAEGQARMLAGGAESRRAAELVRQCWPDQSYESMIVAVLHRPGGLTGADKQYAATLARRFEAAGRPGEILRVIGPESSPEIAERLISADGTVALVADVALVVVRRADHARGGRVDQATGRGDGRHPGGAGTPMDGRRRHRPRLHGRRQDVARPRRRRDDRPAAHRPAVRLSVILAGDGAAGDDRDQRGHRAGSWPG